MATYPDINAELHTVHQQFPGLLHANTHDSGAEFCWRAAKHINSVYPNDRWGLLSKTPPEGGGWVGGVYVSHDVLVHQRTGLQFDIIGSGGSGSPTSPGQRQPIDPKLYRASNKFVDPDSIVIAGPAPSPVPTPPAVKPCPDPKAHEPKPPAQIDPGEMMDELAALDAFYRADEGLQRPNGLSIDGRPDWEGIGAWYGLYLNARLRGESREAAREAYRSQIRGSHEWKAKHAS
jgi:hypothetical protein